jgi:hypothetical protein
MPPNLDDNFLNRPPSDFILFMAPLLPTGPLSDDDSDEATTPSDPEEEDVDPARIVVPLEHNLRGLLVTITPNYRRSC